MERRLRLRAPQRRVEIAKEASGNGEIRGGGGAVASLLIEPSESEVAVRNDRTHAELMRELPCVVVVGFAFLEIAGTESEGDVAEQLEDAGLMPPLLVLQ